MAHIIQRSREKFSHLRLGTYLNAAIVLLLVAGVGLTVLSLRKPTQITSMADTQNCDTVPQSKTTIAPYAQQQTQKQLTAANNTFMQTSRGYNFNQIHQAANSRKKLLIQTMRTNPNLALTKLTTTEDPVTVAKTGPNCIEEQSTVVGKVHVVHSDDFKDNIGTVDYIVTDKTGKAVYVHPANGVPPALSPGNTVKIKGYRLDDDMLTNTQSVDAVQSVSPSTSNSVLGAETESVVGPQNLMVFSFTFQNTNSGSIPVDQANDLVFNQVNKYYAENSYNQMSFVGKVYPQTISIPKSSTCDTYMLFQDMFKAVESKVDLNTYKHLLFIGPLGSECGYSGFSDVGLNPYTDGANNYNVSISVVNYTNPSDTTRTTEHELGHAIGLNHASGVYCNNLDIPVDISDCEFIEYSDMSVMGDGYAQFNAVHKDMLGWFNGNQIQTVTQNGIYSIAPLELPSNSVQALRIPRSNGDFIYAEYRQPLGNYDTIIDGQPTGGVNDGALLHVTDLQKYPFRSFSWSRNPPQTYNLNDTFKDPLTGATLQTVGVSPEKVTVHVTLGKIDFTPPSVIMTSVSSIYTGNVTLSASASAQSGIEKVEFYSEPNNTPIAPTLIGTATKSPYSIQWNTNTVPNGDYLIYAKAYDKSGEQVGVVGNTAISPSQFVTIANAGPTKAEMTFAPDGSTLSGSSQTFKWSTGNSVSEYWLWVGTTSGGYNIYNQVVNGTSTTVSNLPTNGQPIYVRLWSDLPTGWVYNDYTYTAAVNGTTGGSPFAQISSPTPGSTIAIPSTLSWKPVSGATAYWAWIGTTSGGYNILSQNVGNATQITVPSVPKGTNKIYVRLWTNLATTGWASNYTDSSFTVSSIVPTPAPSLVIPTPTPGSTSVSMISPAVGSALSSPTTFKWTSVTNAQGYWIWVGTTSGAANIYSQNVGANTSATVSNIPQNGSPVYVRIWTEINGLWSVYKDFTYTTAKSVPTPTPSIILPSPTVSATLNTMTTPIAGSHLPSSVTFQWSKGTSAQASWLWIGTTPGSANIYSQNLGIATSATVSNIPQSGNVYVRLWTEINGVWGTNYKDYTYFGGGIQPTPTQSQ